MEFLGYGHFIPYMLGEMDFIWLFFIHFGRDDQNLMSDAEHPLMKRPRYGTIDNMGKRTTLSFK